MTQPIREVEFVVDLAPGDRIRERFTKRKNQLLEFVVQFEALIEGKWQPIVDTILLSDREMFEKNLRWSNEFTKYVFEHPEILDRIPAGAKLVFLPGDDPELCRRNLELARVQTDEDRPIVHVRLTQISGVQTVTVTVPEVEVISGEM